jgi:myo-inositol 2-dehydrogenase/D-chiro-inositol 1-dehydrogenase
MGRLHASNIAKHPNARLHSTYDVDSSAADALATDLDAHACRTVEEALQDDQAEAVVIATPATTHAALVVAAARAGKAIFCEKPVAAGTNDAVVAVQAVRSAGVPNFVGFMKRFDAGFKSLIASVRQGDIGDVELSLITNRDPKVTILEYLRATHDTAPFALFRESTVHDCDLQLAILGNDISEVYAAASALVSTEIAELDEIDTAMITLRTAGGALGHINNSWRAVYGYDQRVEVLGSAGMLLSENRPATGNTLYSSTGMHRGKLFGGPDETSDFFMFKYAQAYRDELDYFVSCTTSGLSMSPSLADGLRAQFLVDAAIQSYRSNRPVTVLSEDHFSSTTEVT